MLVFVLSVSVQVPVSLSLSLSSSPSVSVSLCSGGLSLPLSPSPSPCAHSRRTAAAEQWNQSLRGALVSNLGHESLWSRNQKSLITEKTSNRVLLGRTLQLFAPPLY